jgi:hypothetical protein
MAGFEVIIYGRFWVIAEGCLLDGRKRRYRDHRPGHGAAQVGQASGVIRLAKER